MVFLDKNRQKVLQTVKQLNPIDDPMFAVVAKSKDFCQEVLRAILEDPGLIVNKNIVQDNLKNLHGRSVILDAKCTLSDGTEVDIEVQKANDDDHQKRVRYNGAILTTNIAEPGIKFKNVPNVCVVFISRFDLFKKGRTIYHVIRTIKETGDVVDNGFKEIYVNSKVDDGSNIAKLMQIFTNSKVYNDKLFPKVSEQKRYLKETQEGDKSMCEAVKELVEECAAERVKELVKECVEEGKAESIKSVMKSLNVSVNRACDILNIPKEDMEKYLAYIK